MANSPKIYKSTLKPKIFVDNIYPKLNKCPSGFVVDYYFADMCKYDVWSIDCPNREPCKYEDLCESIGTNDKEHTMLSENEQIQIVADMWNKWTKEIEICDSCKNENQNECHECKGDE